MKRAWGARAGVECGESAGSRNGVTSSETVGKLVDYYVSHAFYKYGKTLFDSTSCLAYVSKIYCNIHKVITT